MLTYPDLTHSQFRIFARICKKKIKKHGKRFVILFVFSALALLPLYFSYRQEIHYLLTGLFTGRVIELIGEALMDFGEEV